MHSKRYINFRVAAAYSLHYASLNSVLSQEFRALNTKEHFSMQLAKFLHDCVNFKEGDYKD